MKYLKYFVLILLCIISFYLSDQVILYVENISPIMKSIKSIESDMEVEAVDAIIDGNTIIPGIKGSIVNERESYLKMNEFGTFNENFLVYDYINPNISLSDNLDKIIISTQKYNYVSIIIDNWKYLDYLNDINFAFLIDSIDEYKDIDNVTYINNSMDNYNKINKYLKKKKKLSNIILYGNIQETNNYIILPTIDIYNTNFSSSLSKIKGGEIIYVHDNVSLVEFKLLLERIKYKNLLVMELSDFISE
jgi:hypothetical protein